MKLYKVKQTSTVGEKLTELKHTYGSGFVAEISAVRYEATAFNAQLHLYDADGDEFIMTLKSQQEPNTYLLDHAIPVKLPLYYFDTKGGNKLTVFGKIAE